MGTRADFYVGRGKDSEWIGSIAFDGYPSGIDDSVLNAGTEQDYRARVDVFFRDGRDDVTLPDQGWPWPWDDSRTTDYAYAFEDGKVHASVFGSAWFDPLKPQDDDDGDLPKTAEFPDMTERKNVIFGKRSGVIVLRSP